MSTSQALKPNSTTFGLGVLLECPCCGSAMSNVCGLCGFRMELREGIWNALPHERESHFARFVSDYERIRKAEGRCSRDSDFYLALPYRDRTGNNTGQWKIRARSYEFMLRRILKPALADSDGRVLDIGAGNCWLSFRLAQEGYRPFAVDLLTNAEDGLGAAEHYRGALPGLFPRFRAEMNHLPFRDHQFDAAIFNASFHYAEDYEETLRETLRCVLPGGVIILCDSPWYSSERGGERMLTERRAAFLAKYGTASDALPSREYLTSQRLSALEESLSLQWAVYSPYYGLRWAMRPLVAWLRGRREPSRFCIYVIRKNS